MSDEELRAENKALREELEDVRARLNRALAERQTRGPMDVLIWAFWLLLVCLLAAALYRVLARAPEPAKPPAAAEPAPVQPKNPAAVPPTLTKPPVSAQPEKPAKPAQKQRFPGFPDVSPKGK